MLGELFKVEIMGSNHSVVTVIIKITWMITLCIAWKTELVAFVFKYRIKN